MLCLMFYAFTFETEITFGRMCVEFFSSKKALKFEWWSDVRGTGGNVLGEQFLDDLIYLCMKLFWSSIFM